MEGRDYRIGLDLTKAVDRAIVFDYDQMIRAVPVRIRDVPTKVLLIVPFTQAYFNLDELIEFSSVCQVEAWRRFDSQRYANANVVVDSVVRDICFYRSDFIDEFG